MSMQPCPFSAYAVRIIVNAIISVLHGLQRFIRRFLIGNYFRPGLPPGLMGYRFPFSRDGFHGKPVGCQAVLISRFDHIPVPVTDGPGGIHGIEHLHGTVRQPQRRLNADSPSNRLSHTCPTRFKLLQFNVSNRLSSSTTINLAAQNSQKLNQHTLSIKVYHNHSRDKAAETYSYQ